METEFWDALGFAVPPELLPRYCKYAKIYKEEEEERTGRWKLFLESLAEQKVNFEENSHPANVGVADDPKESFTRRDDDDPKESFTRRNDEGFDENLKIGHGIEKDDDKLDNLEESILIKDSDQAKLGTFHDSDAVSVLMPSKSSVWADISSSLSALEKMMSYRLKRKSLLRTQQNHKSMCDLAPIDEATPLKGASSEYYDDEFCGMDQADIIQVIPSYNNEITTIAFDRSLEESEFPWIEEMECLVRGGVPMDLRGELWQAFVGVQARKVDGYYQSLLVQEKNGDLLMEPQTEKWKGQIEKDLPRTFPGHPSLDEDGRNALRRLLTAYARHNPSVGYCQAMNFFAGLLLLLMPEENAFWTLLCIMDDYFEGYYTEEMIESQVDQLVLEDIIRDRLPKLVNHFDNLGMQMAWVTGPWFLSIYLNMIPWESALRIWDVLLLDGNRVMLFRTALALLELYGSALAATKDAGDTVTLLQSLTGSTFDGSQLVLAACMGYQTVNELKLQELRKKYRIEVVETMEKRSRGLKDSKGLASHLYSFKLDPSSLLLPTNSTEVESGRLTVGNEPLNLDGFSSADTELDLKEQVRWLKVQSCRLLKEKKSASLRAKELETALMEMVKEDNRRLLCAKVEELEKEVSELQLALTGKQEQERAMIQALMKMEQEQKIAEDARISAEQAAAGQKYAANVLQEKYEEALNELEQMEKRAVMAETLLEATAQYQSAQEKAQQQKPHSPRTQQISEDSLARRGLLSRPFGLGWFDKSKGKPNNEEEPKMPNKSELDVSTSREDMNGHQTSG